MKLTGKQARFIKEWLVDCNATQAAIRAGYSRKSACIIGFENLRKPYLQEALAKQIKKMGEATELTCQWVLAGLKREAERDGEGSSHGARVSAYKAIGEHLGMFPKKVEMTGKNGGPIQGEVQHDIAAVLDPCRDGIDDFLRQRLEDLHGNGSAQPLDTARSTPQANGVPPQR